MNDRPVSNDAPPAIEFACPGCGKQFALRPEFAGRTTRCSACKQPLLVPGTADATLPAPASGTRPDDAATPAPAEPTIPATVAMGGAPTRQAAPALLVGSSPMDRYVVGAEIARGGMGTVLQAVDREIRREVAVKYLLDHSDRRKQLRFIEEAQITGQLEHPNIVPIHELGLDAGKRLFFSMKMVRGRSLAQVLEIVKQDAQAATKEYALPRLLEVFVNVCNALAYAHSRGVVHRDLKPANVMLGDFGEVYVMDWGVAKVVRDPDGADALVAVAVPVASVVSAATEAAAPLASAVPTSLSGRIVTSRDEHALLTQDGAIVGTPVYMPPEQATGRIDAIDERSDIYALGAMLYEILTLEPPFDKTGGAVQILSRVTKGEIVAPAQRNPGRARTGHIPPELAAVAMKALARRPDERYQTVEYLRRDIQRFLDGRSVSAKEDTRTELLVKFVKRNQALTAVSAAAALVLAVVVTWSFIVNRRARLDAETAYQAFAVAQIDKEARTRQAVPALVKVAQLEVEQHRLDEALTDINLALEYDPGHADALFLRAMLLAARQDFTGAAADLDRYLAGKPKNQGARDLKEWCVAARIEDEDKSSIVQVAQGLAWHGYPSLAEALLRRHGTSADEVRQELLKLYRARITQGWRVKGESLTLDPDGFRLKVNSQEIRDFQVLKGMALTALEITCPQLDDISALAGMPLKELSLDRHKVTDFSPLKGLPLAQLRLKDASRVADLGLLAGMQLTTLHLDDVNPAIEDLAALRGMRLESLRLTGAGSLSDLSALAGMPLHALELVGCIRLSNLAPLKGMPLTSLRLAGAAAVRDLTPLRGMPLEHLDLSGSAVADLAVLRGMPLHRLDLRRCVLVTDLGPLQGLSLRMLQLAGCSAVADLSPLKGMSLSLIDLSGSSVKDLAPLRGMPLIDVGLANCSALSDLSALAGMPLSKLNLTGCAAFTDLTPLRGMPLNALHLDGCAGVADLAPLQGMRLNILDLSGCKKITNLAPLREAVLTKLELNGCTGLTDLAGLQGMRCTTFDLVNCTNLQRLSGLKGSAIGSLRIDGCEQLQDLTGLEDLALNKLTLARCPRLQDLSALKGLPIKHLALDRCDAVSELATLATLPLETLIITRCPQVANVSALAGVPLTGLTLTYCPQVADVSALRGSRIADLNLAGSAALADLTPLKGLPLQQLSVAGSAVKDLAPLRKMPTLESLHLERCVELHDLAPLADLKLHDIRLPPQVHSGLEALRAMPGLRLIDGLPAQLYWVNHDRVRPERK